MMAQYKNTVISQGIMDYLNDPYLDKLEPKPTLKCCDFIKISVESEFCTETCSGFEFAHDEKCVFYDSVTCDCGHSRYYYGSVYQIGITQCGKVCSHELDPCHELHGCENCGHVDCECCVDIICIGVHSMYRCKQCTVTITDD